MTPLLQEALALAVVAGTLVALVRRLRPHARPWSACGGCARGKAGPGPASAGVRYGSALARSLAAARAGEAAS